MFNYLVLLIILLGILFFIKKVLNPIFFPKKIEMKKLESILNSENLVYIDHKSARKKESDFFNRIDAFDSFFELTQFQVIYFKVKCLDQNSNNKTLWLKYSKSFSLLYESKYDYIVE